jgi:hypothetical protein
MGPRGEVEEFELIPAVTSRGWVLCDKTVSN